MIIPNIWKIKNGPNHQPDDQTMFIKLQALTIIEQPPHITTITPLPGGNKQVLWRLQRFSPRLRHQVLGHLHVPRVQRVLQLRQLFGALAKHTKRWKLQGGALSDLMAMEKETHEMRNIKNQQKTTI